MTWHDRFVVGGGLIAFSLPLALCVLALLKRNQWGMELVAWRSRVWRVGFVITFTISCLMPLYLAGMGIFRNSQSRIMVYLSWSTRLLILGLLISPVSLLLLAFGKGRLRLIMMIAAALACSSLFITLLAMSK